MPAHATSITEAREVLHGLLSIVPFIQDEVQPDEHLQSGEQSAGSESALGTGQDEKESRPTSPCPLQATDAGFRSALMEAFGLQLCNSLASVLALHDLVDDAAKTTGDIVAADSAGSAPPGPSNPAAMSMDPQERLTAAPDTELPMCGALSVLTVRSPARVEPGTPAATNDWD